MDDDEEEEDYEYGSDADEYNYSDEEGEQGNDELIEIENVFYEADDCRQDDPAKAVEMFEKVVTLEQERGAEVKWRFKALEHLVVLHCRLGNAEQMVEKYKEMLSHAGTVTRNECGDSVNAVLEAISAAAEQGNNTTTQGDQGPLSDQLATMYDVTFQALKAANNERLWFNTNVKVGKVYLQRGDYRRVSSIVDELRAACRGPDGADDLSKGSSLLEVYALEIQLCAAVQNSDRMKRIYPKTLNLTAAVADPRIMGVIREEGGKMYMRDAAWGEAYEEFYEGFRAYQEAGNARAKDCLKYVVLANMLATSDINPFDAREAKAYQEEPEITAMKRLRLAYDANDLHAFERALASKHGGPGSSSGGASAKLRSTAATLPSASRGGSTPARRILDDPFVMSYVDPLRRKMREQVILNLVKPYHRLTLSFIADQLGLETAQVHDIVVDMILDHRVHGAIDHVQQHLLLDGDVGGDGEYDRHAALANWADTLDDLGISSAARLQ